MTIPSASAVPAPGPTALTRVEDREQPPFQLRAPRHGDRRQRRPPCWLMGARDCEQMVGVGGRLRPVANDRFVASAFPLNPQRAGREPDEWVEPVDGTGDVRHELRRAVVPPHMVELVQQHDPLPGGRPDGAGVGHQHNRAEPAPRHRHHRAGAAQNSDRSGQPDPTAQLADQSLPLAVTWGRGATAKPLRRHHAETDSEEQHDDTDNPEPDHELRPPRGPPPVRDRAGWSAPGPGGMGTTTGERATSDTAGATVWVITSADTAVRTSASSTSSTTTTRRPLGDSAGIETSDSRTVTSASAAPTNASNGRGTGRLRAGRKLAPRGSMSAPASASAQTRCRRFADERRSTIAMAPATSRMRERRRLVSTSATSPGIGRPGEKTELIHGYRPSFRALSMRPESLSRSSSESFECDMSSKAATACSAEPSKNVCTTCFNADRLAR